MLDKIEKIKEYLTTRRQAYVTTFCNPVGDRVLKDLARFCRAGRSTFHTDPRVSALLQGRQEVWERIADHLNLSPEELYDLYHQGKTPGE